jgi:VanZ family protein
MVVVFLLPVPSNPIVESKHMDKLVHFGIFFLFAVLLLVDRQRGVWWTFLISVVFAGGIELAQSALPFRDGDWLDLVAGAAGAALGAVVGTAIAPREIGVNR